MNNTVKTVLLLCTGAVVGISLTLTQGVSAGREPTSELPLSELQTFVEILNRVQQDYVEQIDDDALLESAIRGMLSGLDPHSAYLDAQEFKDITVSTSGKFGGLGIEVQGQNGFVRVIAPIDDTPAQRAGVEAGDLIIKVNDKAVKGLTLTESVRLMRGEPGTKVTLDVVREGEAQPLQIDIVRDIIEVRSVRSRMLEPNYGYLRISTFTGGTGRLLEEELQKLRARNDGALRGLVLDLRTNPGGVLNAAVDVSDAFLNRGEIVSIKGRSNQANRTFNATPGDLLDGVPLVVLINEASASASEIVAGALQDHSRAVLVGAKTFGKGSVQTIVPLGGQGAMRLTTARYYTPSGRSIQAKGIEPDIFVPQARVEELQQARRRSEADLRGALANPDDGEDETGASDEESEAAPEEEAAPDQDAPADEGAETDSEDPEDEQTAQEEEQERATQDYQLSRAIDLLRGIALYNQRTVN